MSSLLAQTEALEQSSDGFSLNASFGHAVSGIKNWFGNLFRPTPAFAKAADAPNAPALNNGLDNPNSPNYVGALPGAEQAEVTLSVVDVNRKFEPTKLDRDSATIAGGLIIEKPDTIVNAVAPREPLIATPIKTAHVEDGGIAFSYEESDAAREMQIQLKDLGYETGPIDGKPGPLTMAAVAKFQEDHADEITNITPDFADPTTLATITLKHSLLEATPEANATYASNSFGVDSLIDYITQYESSGDYNLAFGDKPFNGEHKLTEMTISDVRTLQDELVQNGSPSSAVGGVQIIRKTMDSLIDEMGLTGDELFDENMQNDMAIHLLERRGLSEYQNGEISLAQFTTKLSQEWASLPKDSSGLSYYHGDGLNYAHASHDGLQGVLKGLTAPDTGSTMIADASDAIEKNSNAQVTWTVSPVLG